MVRVVTDFGDYRGAPYRLAVFSGERLVAHQRQWLWKWLGRASRTPGLAYVCGSAQSWAAVAAVRWAYLRGIESLGCTTTASFDTTHNCIEHTVLKVGRVNAVLLLPGWPNERDLLRMLRANVTPVFLYPRRG